MRLPGEWAVRGGCWAGVRRRVDPFVATDRPLGARVIASAFVSAARPAVMSESIDRISPAGPSTTAGLVIVLPTVPAVRHVSVSECGSVHRGAPVATSKTGAPELLLCTSRSPGPTEVGATVLVP